MSAELAISKDLLTEIKSRVRQAQQRAALSANAEMIRLYWDIGRLIAARQQEEGWGASVIPRLSAALKNELPEEKGFSPTNLKRMTQFFSEYPRLFPKGAQAVPLLSAGPPVQVETGIGAQLVPQFDSPSGPDGLALAAIAQLSWGHNVVLIQKVKHLATRVWHARQALEQGWSRADLTVQIKTRAHERQGTAVTNFSHTLPAVHASLAQGLLKDPYLFDFLILCQTKDRVLAEYSLRDIHKPIGVADYEITRALPAELASSLPSIDSLEEELSGDLGEDSDQEEGGGQ